MFARMFPFFMMLCGIDSSWAVEVEKATSSNGAQVPVSFGEVRLTDASTVELDLGEASLKAADMGKRTTLFGRITDTSTINLFHATWYDGRRTGRRRYYVKDRVYRRPHEAEWVAVEATITKVDVRDDDKHELQIHSFHGLSTKEVQAIGRAFVKSQQ